jgi:hypothetical protein
MLEEEILRRASMERLDSATTGLIEQEVLGRLPEGMVDGVAVLSTATTRRSNRARSWSR